MSLKSPNPSEPTQPAQIHTSPRNQLKSPQTYATNPNKPLEPVQTQKN